MSHAIEVFPKSLAARYDYVQALKPAKPTPLLLPRTIDLNFVRSLGFQCMRLERIAVGNIKSRRASRLDCMNGFLTFDVSDLATDTELLILLESLTTRVENAITRLYLSQLNHVVSQVGFPEIGLGLTSLHSVVDIDSLIAADTILSQLSHPSQDTIKKILRPAPQHSELDASTKPQSDFLILSVTIPEETMNLDPGNFENYSSGRFMFQI